VIPPVFGEAVLQFPDFLGEIPACVVLLDLDILFPFGPDVLYEVLDLFAGLSRGGFQCLIDRGSGVPGPRMWRCELGR
jgi:hypothetical protein